MTQEYIITEAQLEMWRIVTPMDPMCQELRQMIRSRPIQSSISNDEQCRICSQSELDKILDKKELQYLNCLIKDDIVRYPDGWFTLPHVESTLRQSVLNKIESLRSSSKSCEI